MTTTADMDDSRLRTALTEIERPLLREPSVKSIGGQLITGRYLLSFPRGALGPGPSRSLRQILTTLNAPKPGIAQLDRVQSLAPSVHFGFEPDPNGTVFKCYLEFAATARPQPDLIFVALKWRASGAWTVSLYHDRDALPLADQSALIRDILPPGMVRDRILDLLQTPLGTDALRLLEVTEPDSPRRSIDLNLSETGVTLATRRADLLGLLGASYGAATYLDQHANDRLGHVAAGTARDGAAFATLYHGAHRVTGKL